MSSISIAGDTSGSVIIAAPAVAGSTTLTLPTTTGTLVTSNAMPTGSVLQVVNATYSTQVISSSNTFIDSGLSASITPSSSSNKILVLVSLQFWTDSGGNLGAQIVRGSSTSVVSQDYLAWGPSFMTNTFLQGLDSPATTSSTTYKVQFKKRSGGGSVYVQYADSNGTGLSSITLLEIKG